VFRLHAIVTELPEYNLDDEEQRLSPAQYQLLIKEMEGVLMPELQKRANRLQSDVRFTDVRLASMRHADWTHTIGLGCHPIGMPSPDERYSIGINILAYRGLLMRGFVTWSQTYVSKPIKKSTGEILGYNHVQGYTVREGITRLFYFQPGEELDDFIQLLPPLYRAFDRGTCRGHPPGSLRRLWSRLISSEK